MRGGIGGVCWGGGRGSWLCMHIILSLSKLYATNIIELAITSPYKIYKLCVLILSSFIHHFFIVGDNHVVITLHSTWVIILHSIGLFSCRPSFFPSIFFCLYLNLTKRLASKANCRSSMILGSYHLMSLCMKSRK